MANTFTQQNKPSEDAATQTQTPPTHGQEDETEIIEHHIPRQPPSTDTVVIDKMIQKLDPSHNVHTSTGSGHSATLSKVEVADETKTSTDMTRSQKQSQVDSKQKVTVDPEMAVKSSKVQETQTEDEPLHTSQSTINLPSENSPITSRKVRFIASESNLRMAKASRRERLIRKVAADMLFGHKRSAAEVDDAYDGDVSSCAEVSASPTNLLSSEDEEENDEVVQMASFLPAVDQKGRVDAEPSAEALDWSIAAPPPTPASKFTSPTAKAIRATDATSPTRAAELASLNLDG